MSKAEKALKKFYTVEVAKSKRPYIYSRRLRGKHLLKWKHLAFLMTTAAAFYFVSLPRIIPEFADITKVYVLENQIDQDVVQYLYLTGEYIRKGENQ